MVEAIVLGFHDMLRNKRVFTVFLICLSLICIIVISSTSSLIRELDSMSITEDTEFTELNTVVPISHDMSANADIVNELNQLLKKNGKTFFFSEQLSNQIELPTYVVIDSELNQLHEEQLEEARFAKIYSQINSERIMGIEFPEPAKFESSNVSYFDERIFESFYEIVIVLLKTDRLDKWIDTDSGLEIMELIEYASVNKIYEEEMVAELEVILEGSFLSYQPSNYQNIEIDFIKYYVYPTVGLVLLSLLISLIIMYISLFKKLSREYTIHLISGASLKHIYARNSVFNITLVFACLLIVSFLNGFQINYILGITSAVLTFVFIVFEGLLYLTLTRKDLSMTLRGAY